MPIIIIIHHHHFIVIYSQYNHCECGYIHRFDVGTHRFVLWHRKRRRCDFAAQSTFHVLVSGFLCYNWEKGAEVKRKNDIRTPLICKFLNTACFELTKRMSSHVTVIAPVTLSKCYRCNTCVDIHVDGIVPVKMI